MLRKFIALGIALSVATLSLAPALVHAQSIVIGQSTPLSGGNKELGEDIRDGALAYFKKVNEAGGINGRKIELITLDDANDVKKSEANTRALIDQHNAVALFGYASATLSMPALPLVERAKMTFFAPFTGAEPMRQFNRYVFNHRASYSDELAAIVEHYTSIGVKRFAVLHYDDAVGKENFAAVSNALKSHQLEPVAVAAVKRPQTDFTKEVAAVSRANPELVITTTAYKTTSDFIKLTRQGDSVAQFVSISFAGSTALAVALGEQGIGVAMSQVVPPVNRSSIGIVKEYQQAMGKLTGKQTYSYTSLESFIAAKVLVEGIKRAGAAVTRDSVLKSLDNLGNFDVGGYAVNFTPSNHNGSRYVGMTILSRDLAFRD
ncbi:MAG TPA: ABC transporter substrate-binding protein [Burkholderiales bacterium]|nr:ABC transporter substrate-binding protein [Burkholderiales bacterium]